MARYYHVTPAYDKSSLWDLSDVDKLDRACLWGGSFPYVFNGSYVEGTNYYMGGITGGIEVVYDFATMQRGNFTYPGLGLDSNINLGFSGNVYVGAINGFKSQANRHNEFSILNYEGPFISGWGGVGFKLLSAGLIGFSAPDGSIWGYGLYASVGGSINDLLEEEDTIPLLPPPYVAGGAWTIYSSKGEIVEYTRKLANGTYTTVDRTKLINDIHTGSGSPFEKLYPIYYPTARILARVNALGAAEIHDAVYIESKQ